jgi:hypothetical protein
MQYTIRGEVATVPKRRRLKDSLAAMRARKQISAEQYRAARAWQKLHKQAARADSEVDSEVARCRAS